MRARIEEREQARTLRRQGYSFGEISKLLGASKSTLSGWLNDIELTEEQKGAILSRALAPRRRGQQVGAWRNRQKKLERASKIVEAATREFTSRVHDPLFVTGLALFWAEGAKTDRHFHFINSDPNAIRIMVKWLTECAGIPKEKIVARCYVHRIYADHGFDEFWKRVTKLSPSQFRSPVYKATPHTVRKNPTYNGCCRLSVFSSELFWSLRGWQQSLLEYFGVDTS